MNCLTFTVRCEENWRIGCSLSLTTKSSSLSFILAKTDHASLHKHLFLQLILELQSNLKENPLTYFLKAIIRHFGKLFTFCCEVEEKVGLLEANLKAYSQSVTVPYSQLV